MTNSETPAPMTQDPAPEPLLEIKSQSGQVVLSVTAEAVWLNPDVPPADASRMIIDAVQNYFRSGAESRAQEVMQLQASCWQLTQARDQLFAELQKHIRQGAGGA